MQVIARQGLDTVRRYTPYLLLISFVLLLLVLVPGFGVKINGARRWIGAGPLQFQPAELMKLALVLHSASVIAARPKLAHNLRTAAGPILGVGAAAVLLVAAQPDLGTALVICFTLAAMLVAAGLPLRQLGLIAAVGAFLVLVFAILEPYRRARLTSFINPWADAGGNGFQSVQGQIALGSGGFFGLGPGQSVQKIFYLPEAHTDFILAVIGEELGVAGICVLLALYGMIGYAGLRTAKAAKGAYAKLLAAGLTSLILCQALLNIYTVLGLAPLTGVPLPFISSGSSSLIVLAMRDGVAAQRRPGRARRRCARCGRVTTASAARPPRIVIAAGGTAGHVVPALAIADALRAEGAEVVFAGGERAEAQLVPAAGYQLEPLRVEGISRSNPLKAARAVLRAAGAVGTARKLLARHEADAVLGGGGYVAGPVGLAALMRRIPMVLTEADSHLGLTNRLLAPRARRVCLAFPIAGRDGERYLVTGRPVPPTVGDRAAARAEFGIPPEATCVLVFGGSLGARSINLAAVEAFADAPFHVLHVPGSRDFAELRAPGAALPPARVRHARSGPRWSPPTSPSRGPAGRCSSSPSTACRRS